MGRDSKFSYESLQDVKSIQDYFKALLDCFEKKRIILASGEEEVVFPVAELIKLGIKAKKKDGEYKLTIKLEWKDKNTLAPEQGKISISA